MHDLRHTFAVHVLETWVREGKDLRQKLPVLSGYMGHALRGRTAGRGAHPFRVGWQGMETVLLLYAERNPEDVPGIEHVLHFRRRVAERFERLCRRKNRSHRVVAKRGVVLPEVLVDGGAVRVAEVARQRNRDATRTRSGPDQIQREMESG